MYGVAGILAVAAFLIGYFLGKGSPKNMKWLCSDHYYIQKKYQVFDQGYYFVLCCYWGDYVFGNPVTYWCDSFYYDKKKLDRFNGGDSFKKQKGVFLKKEKINKNSTTPKQVV
ncbi:MAG: hypothetical protein A3F47_00775 [Candidatus Staskawiczbacteria bacterium RIFCSPHIGHO2_12_FULL_38_11]|uniref:Uncharacterized protein n=1 Tax=Candidatus Staskawiczbacteria bacterium RIFCSPHIGHO2_12_FULL_38_11 TaxID=1802209 RepID=A0A1G2I6H9_9BACT|nr:MAG: hypothetical protein A3F47_00775 [Candidatus Staskawiczbacteria bacterium RIFCSPHIGHO2_12_FULL_38_11]